MTCRSWSSTCANKVISSERYAGTYLSARWSRPPALAAAPLKLINDRYLILYYERRRYYQGYKTGNGSGRRGPQTETFERQDRPCDSWIAGYGDGRLLWHTNAA